MSATGAVQLHAREVSVERGGNMLLEAVSLSVGPGDRIGLIGPNGAGKSSLLAVLAGRLEPLSGTVEIVPGGAAVGLLAQELDIDPTETIAQYLGRRTGVARASIDLDAATSALGIADSGVGPSAMDRYQVALERWMALGGADLEGRIDAVLAEVGLAPSAVSHGHLAGRLSGGQQARVGLAALFLARYEVLLLDEPTNDLDQGGLDLLESFVLNTPSPLVVVSHDRRFLERVATAVVELDPHRRTATRFNESFQDYLEAKEIVRAQAQRRYDDYDQERARLTDRASRQRDWAVKGVRGERNPPDNDRAARGARIERTEQLAHKARQTERALDRLAAVEKPWVPWELRFTIGNAERSGDLVAELVEAEVALGSFRLGPVTIEVGAGERIAVVGGNGQGKTTLISALFGHLALDGGRQRSGRSTVVGWLDQARESLAGDASVLDFVVEQTGMATGECRAVLAKFGLGAAHLDRAARLLSPGERTRAVLAVFQATGVNTLVLDEPTNHLDLSAIAQLEAALDRFEGTVLLVTHDRAFLDSTTLTRSIVIEGGRVVDDVPL